MWYITIVTGTSGAGKSTLKNLFMQSYWWAYQIYDFDDVGVPAVFPDNRRQDTTAHRMTILRNHQKASEPVVLFGQVVPDEIVWSKDDILFIFLDAPREQIQQRLKERGRTKEFIQTYQSRDEHIKQSALNQTYNLILSTHQPLQECLQQLHQHIRRWTANKTS